MRDMSMRRRKAFALLAGAMVPVLLLAGVLLPTSLEETEAGWVAETKASAGLGAAEIPAPQLTRQCQYVPIGLLGLTAEVRIHWALPDGYALSDVIVQQSSNGLGSLLQPISGFTAAGATNENTDGTYTTTVPTGLLGGLAGLGSGLYLYITVKDASGWTSESAIIMARSGVLIGLGSGCWNQT